MASTWFTISALGFLDYGFLGQGKGRGATSLCFGEGMCLYRKQDLYLSMR